MPTLPFHFVLKGASASTSDDEGFDFALDRDGTPEPVVFVLGWAGCTDRWATRFQPADGVLRPIR